MITLWTIQEEMALKELKKTGELTALKFNGLPECRNAYEWMKNQTVLRIGKPKSMKQYPIWAWFQHIDAKQKMPDLRRAGHLPSGTKGVRIKFRKKQNEVLLSDFELWHYPLSFRAYIPNSQNDERSFNKQLGTKRDTEFEKLPKTVKTQIENSWQKIFDMNFESKYVSRPIDEKSIQATLWQINEDEILETQRFTAK